METKTVTIHCRYALDGTTLEIGERPEGLNPNEWFKVLSEQAGDTGEPLAGGRFVFKVPADKLAEIKASVAKAA
jgi:hypothetical protein